MIYMLIFAHLSRVINQDITLYIEVESLENKKLFRVSHMSLFVRKMADETSSDIFLEFLSIRKIIYSQKGCKHQYHECY